MSEIFCNETSGNPLLPEKRRRASLQQLEQGETIPVFDVSVSL